MITITLPEHLASSHLLAGIEFNAGSASVDRLGTNVRHYFALIGATITDSAPEAPAPTDPEVDAPAPVEKPRRSKKE
ncbi:hypothetical protein PTQ19_10375 [Microbacterium esteraromaticum]|uniref:hypothetical protein n=1 Tax=Microbacterium esteraromaticum TaxID=57043 RepID=UPI002367ABBC|nr:hypothetical protein [Microbacterium esteraromaticum]WDH77927.1 hypothetical protein PTQ19_10375 [Microbacterium esteraromaticum]